MYGLKQAGRQWNHKINEILIKMGFTQCKTDSCIFISHDKNEISIIALYVDDILLSCYCSKIMENILENLKKYVDIVDRGPASYYLVMEIERNGSKGDIQVIQKHFVNY